MSDTNTRVVFNKLIIFGYPILLTESVSFSLSLTLQLPTYRAISMSLSVPIAALAVRELVHMYACNCVYIVLDSVLVYECFEPGRLHAVCGYVAR